MHLLRATGLKLRRRPATYRTVLVLAGLLAFLYLSIGVSAAAISDPTARASLLPLLAFPDAGTGLASILLIFGGIAGAGYAGAVAASEWSWNTFRVALTRGESRVRYVVILFVGIALLVVVAWLLLCVLGTGLVLLGATLGGIPTASPLDPASLNRLLATVVTGGWAVLMEVAIGFGVAFASRSPVAGIAAVAGLYFVEQFAVLIVPIDVLRFAPITAAGSLVSAAGRTGFDASLAAPLVVTTLYLFLAIAAAAAVARRAEVS
jgi:hypothetical protein